MNKPPLKIEGIGSLYESILNSIPVGVYIWRHNADGSMGFEYVNQPFCSLLGLESDAILSDYRCTFDIVHPDDIESLNQVNREARESLTSFDWTGRFMVHGEVRWIQIKADPTPEADGGSLWTGVISDITDQKMGEQLVTKWSDAFNHAALGIALGDVNTNTIIETNPAFANMLGYSNEELIGKPILDLYPEAERAQVLQELTKVLDHDVSRYESRLVHKGGSTFPVQVDLATVRDQSGKPVFRVATAQDITWRKHSEALLHLQGEIVKNAAAGIALVKLDGTFYYTNTQFEGMFGYAPGELLGKSVSIVNAPTKKSPEETAAEIMSALERDGRWSGEIWNRKKDGSDLWTVANVSSFQDPELGTLLISHQVDITERKQLESSLQQEHNLNASILKLAGPVIMVVDHTGAIVSFNRTAEELSGYSFEEVRGKPYFWKHFLSPEERSGVEEVFEAAMVAVGNVHSQFENHWIDKHGGKRLISWSNSILTDELGEAHSLITIGIDITERRHAEEELKASEMRLKKILNASPISVHIATKQGRELMFCNASYADIIENPNPIEDDPRNYYVYPEEYDEIIEATARGESVTNRQVELLVKGNIVWVLASYMPMQYMDVEAVLGWFYDITTLKDFENTLRIAAITFESQEGMMVTNADGNILRVNEAFTHITGYPAADVIGKNSRVLQSGRMNKDFYESMWNTIRKDGFWSGEIWNRRKIGEIFPAQLTITAVKDDDGRVTNYVGSILDITERKISEAQIQQLAYYDHLTGLPNRRLFRDRLEQDIKRVARNGSPLALLFIDLDRFKEVNDTLGHNKGDMLLIEVAKRIRQHVRDTDTFARLGGDEFTIILPEYGEISSIERVVQKVVHDLALPFDLGDGDISHISCSIGIALYPLDAESIENLLKHADQAMYAAKQGGRNGFSYFTRSMQEELKEKRH